jgi:transmembrane sensor
LITQETITRFFNDDCTPQEAADVLAYLEANPQVLDGLANEWDAFQNHEKLTPDFSNKIWNSINRETREAPVRSIYLKRFAAAASIAILLGAAWFFLFNKTTTSTGKEVLARQQMKTVENTTMASMMVRFSDSSVAELMPKSSITYPEPFEIYKRKVTLKGEATFAVTKDATRPFTVSSDSIITTVLGTKFTVRSYASDKQIKVLLHEGRVMVTPDGTTFIGGQNAYYLLPGDVFVYNKQTKQALLLSNKSNKTALSNSLPTNRGKGNKIIQGDNWYMFNNQPLSEVFAQLEILYATKIGYNKADVTGLTFIGKLDKSDSLETLLNSIAALNNLRVTRTGNSYLLNKK